MSNAIVPYGGYMHPPYNRQVGQVHPLRLNVPWFALRLLDINTLYSGYSINVIVSSLKGHR